MMEPEPNPGSAESPTDDAAERLLLASRILFKRARWVELSAAVGCGATSAAVAYVTDRMLASLASISRWGSGGTPTPWPPLAAAVVGAVLGFGLARPFADWLRIQARLVEVHLRTESHTRRAGENTEQTARGIRGLADATATFATIGVRSDHRLLRVDEE